MNMNKHAIILERFTAWLQAQMERAKSQKEEADDSDKPGSMIVGVREAHREAFYRDTLEQLERITGDTEIDCAILGAAISGLGSLAPSPSQLSPISSPFP